MFLVWLFVNGKVTPFIIDDSVPYDTQFIGCSSADQELWPSLLEKAWAKLHKAYANIIGGLPNFAFQHLFGTPAGLIEHD
jgi:hypothetical protein